MFKKFFASRNDTKIEKKSTDIDLRHLFAVQLSDAWDGRETCSDGTTWTHIFCDDTCVSTSSVYKDHGATENRTKGIEFWEDMLGISEAYMRLLQIARTKFFHDCTNAKDGDWDKIYINIEKATTLLFNHPQYIETVKLFGITLVPTEIDGKFRVDITKFADR